MSTQYHNPVEATLSIIGGKWKVVILCLLKETETMRFSDLQRAIPDITKKMLSQQLRELEADHIIQRTVYDEMPPRVEYSLTPEGETMRPMLNAMCAWGSRKMGQQVECE